MGSGIGRGQFYAKLSALKDMLKKLLTEHREKVDEVVEDTIEKGGANLFPNSANNDSKWRKKANQKAEKLSANPKANMELIQQSSRINFKWSSMKLKNEESEYKVQLQFGIHNMTQIAESEALGKKEITIKALKMIEKNPILRCKYPISPKEYKPDEFF